MLACLFYETGSHVEQADLKLSCLAEDGLELLSLLPLFPPNGDILGKYHHVHPERLVLDNLCISEVNFVVFI